MGILLTTSALANKALDNSARVTTDGLRAAAKNRLIEETKIVGATTEEIESEAKLIHGEIRNIKVNPGRQEKHILGSKIRNGKTPSVFYGTTEDAQKLVDEFAGTGFFADKLETTERVNFKKVIGIYVDESTGESLETAWGDNKVF